MESNQIAHSSAAGVWLECDSQHVAEAETHQLRDHGLQSMGTSSWNFTLMSTLSTPSNILPLAVAACKRHHRKEKKDLMTGRQRKRDTKKSAGPEGQKCPGCFHPNHYHHHNEIS
jgi:hypothetical protein